MLPVQVSGEKKKQIKHAAVGCLTHFCQNAERNQEIGPTLWLSKDRI